MNSFTLWLEFEHVDFASILDPETGQIVSADWNKKNNFCNIAVTLSDGRRYGINVWTFDYLTTSIQCDAARGKNLNGLYQIPPDLFVHELTRECIEATISDLLRCGNLEQLLNPSVVLRPSTEE